MYYTMIRPWIAYHPGEYLVDALSVKGWTQKEFADIVGISKFEINDIVKWRRNITPRIAARFGEALGMPASSWLNLQNMYDLFLIEKNDEEISHREYIRERVQEMALA